MVGTDGGYSLLIDLVNTPDRTTAAAFPQYPNVQVLADGSSLRWSGIFARRYRYPRVVDSFLVPATPTDRVRDRWLSAVP